MRGPLERVAAEIRKRARVEPFAIVQSPAIARAILGEDGLVFGAEDIAPHFDGQRIVIPLDSQSLNLDIAHELAEWFFMNEQLVFPTHLEKERAADYVAAALLAPAPIVRTLNRRYGEDVAPMACAFGMSQTDMVLRLAEVHGDARAVVMKSNRVLSRGFDDAKIVDLVAYARARRARPGLVRTTLTDAAERVAIRAVN